MEFYKLLWLNPTIVKSLGLVTRITDSGLVSITESGEIVLRMRVWLTDYLGDGMHTRLADEIPRFEGTDLIIRKDYFRKICEKFQIAPSYVVVKFEGRLIKDETDE